MHFRPVLAFYVSIVALLKVSEKDHSTVLVFGNQKTPVGRLSSHHRCYVFISQLCPTVSNVLAQSHQLMLLKQVLTSQLSHVIIIAK